MDCLQNYQTLHWCYTAVREKKYSVWLNKQRNLKQSGVLLSTLMTTECSLEGAPYMHMHSQKHVVVCVHSGHLYRQPVNHIGPQQNVFITVNNVSVVMDNVKNNSIVRGCFHFGGCATEAQHENSHEPSHFYVIVCCFYKYVMVCGPYHFLSPFLFEYCVLFGTYFTIRHPC